MKKVESVLGYPVIDLSNGELIGKVKDVLFNAVNGTIDYVLVDAESDGFISRVVATNDVVGVGEYALTIQNSDVIKELNNTSAAASLVQSGVKVTNTGVLTRKGSLIGKTGDIYFDEENCLSITGIEFIPENNKDSVKVLPAQCVITYGKKLIIVADNALDLLIDDINYISTNTTAVNPEEYVTEPKTDINTEYIESVETQTQTKIEIDTDTDTEEIVNTDVVNTPEASEKVNEQANDTTNAAELFEQRQRQYLVGRRSSKTINDSEGNLIVREGMIINNEIIDDAKSKGKLVELVMNNKA